MTKQTGGEAPIVVATPVVCTSSWQSVRYLRNVLIWNILQGRFQKGKIAWVDYEIYVVIRKYLEFCQKK